MSHNLQLSKKNLKESLENLESSIDKAIAQIKLLKQDVSLLKSGVKDKHEEKNQFCEDQIKEFEKLTVSLKDLKNIVNK